MTASAPHGQPTAGPATPLGRRITFSNNKGGVGKSAVTLLISEGMARLGMRVLLVDLDPQGNLTGRVRVAPAAGRGIGDLLALPSRQIKDAAPDFVVPVGWEHPIAERIDILPADLSLGERDEEAAKPGAAERLSRALYNIGGEYDYVMIDCRPTLGHLEMMAVRALDGDKDGVVVPVEPGRDAVSGAYRIKQKVKEWSDGFDIYPALLGVVVNLYDGQTRLHRARATHLGASLVTEESAEEVHVFKPYVRKAVRLATLQDQAWPSTDDPEAVKLGLVSSAPWDDPDKVRANPGDLDQLAMAVHR